MLVTLPGLTSAQMLQELREAHTRVRTCVDEMDALTAKGVASPLEFTAARFRISNASMAKRACFNGICSRLRKCGVPKTVAVIEMLARLDHETRSKSASHVSQWTAHAIELDWAGYCAASRRIRRAMIEQLDSEKALLFPLLASRSVQSEAAEISPRH